MLYGDRCIRCVDNGYSQCYNNLNLGEVAYKMSSTHIHVRIDEETKKQAQQILNDMGLDLSTAVNMFIKQVVCNRSFPFLPTTDPFFSENNIAHLISVKADADTGRNMVVHDLLED
jgi:DNA-damage-inducible protein J